MNQEDIDKLGAAIALIFQVEVKCVKEQNSYASDTLYTTRIGINNVITNIQK